jgi:hypothetical protein
MAAGSVVAPKANFSWAALFMKYFCEGQITSTTLQAKNGEAIIVRPEAATTFAGRHRKLIALLLPIALVHAIWWAYMIKNDSFDAFTETDNTGKNGIPRWCVHVRFSLSSNPVVAARGGSNRAHFVLIPF